MMALRCKWSSERIGALTANGTSVSRCQGDVSTLSPGRPPWIFDDPITSLHSYQGHSVVNVCLAVVEYSWLVWRPVGCVDWDSYGSGCYCVGQVVAGREDDVVWDRVGTLADLAGILLRDVGVLVIGCYAVLLDVFECVLLEASLAALIPVSVRTVHKLRLREAQ